MKETPKTPFYKKKWFIALMAFILLGTIYGNDDSQQQNTNTQNLVSVETTQEPQEEIAVIETSEPEPIIEEVVEEPIVEEPEVIDVVIEEHIVEENTFIEALVTNVTDGDTITVSHNGLEQKVRLILVDTPETVHPNKGVQFFGAEASNYTREQLLNKTVYLEKDVSETDKYGRYLYYVWLARPKTNNPTDEELFTMNFNSLLLENGYAQMSTYPPDIKYESQFLTRQSIARENSYGLWNVDNATAWEIAQNPPAPEPVNEPVGFVANEEPVEEVQAVPVSVQYIGNANTRKFHKPRCGSVKQMNESNKREINTRDEAINGGYVPCKKCNP